MSVQQPAWLKRTRPCPFFSQGRCLFADSCNFLHDVKVRNSLHQPLPSTSHVQQLAHLPVFDPPSVVVDSPSPRPANSSSPQSLASHVQDSSRYSGLLSVLSDVIGPPSTHSASENAARVTSASLQNTAYGPGSLSESNSVDTSFHSSDDVIHLETLQESSGCSDPSSTPHFASETHSVSPSLGRTEYCFPEKDDEPVTEFLSAPDDTESPDGDAIPYFIEDGETCAIGSAGSSDDEDHEEEIFTGVVSNRQSTLSSFTGASLLASPRSSVFEESRPIEDSTIGLLSPVELSVKLRPFPISSLGLRANRGDSIDSGYADGDNWVGPLLFPRSPPRGFRSSVTFLSHSRQTSRSFPAHKHRVSYDVGAAWLSSHNPVEGTKEVESDGCCEDAPIEDPACTILDTYDKSPFEGQEENKAHHLLQVNLTGVTEIKGDDAPRRYSPGRLRPTREYDVDSCSQPSFTSGDNLSLQTALSAQSSYKDLSDVPKVSPILKLDSLLPSTSACSSPNMSVLFDGSECSGHIIRQNVCESSSFVLAGPENQLDNTRGIEEVSEGSSQPENIVIDSSPLPVSGIDEYSPTKIVMVESLPGTFHFSPTSSTSVNVSRTPPSIKDSFARVSLGVDNIQEFAPPQEPVSGGCQPEKNSPGWTPSSMVENVVGHAPQGADSTLPENADTHAEHQSGDLHFNGDLEKTSSSAENYYSPSLVAANADGVREIPLKSVNGCMEYSSGVLRLSASFPELLAGGENSHDPSPLKELGHAPPGANGNESVSPTDQSQTVGGYLGSNEIIQCLGSGSENFTQRLSFPLPPPFLPTEFVGRSTLSGEDSSILSGATVMDLGGDACIMSQQEGERRVPSGFDLTEKMRPNHLPQFGSPDTDADFTSRRSRAASDLTVKGRLSPVTIYEGTPYILRSPPPPPEERVDLVNSLYDQYIDDGTPDDGLSCHNATPPSNLPSASEETFTHPQHLELTFQRGPSPYPHEECNGSGEDSPRSETVLRPLLTGKRFLCSSLAEFIPKAHPDSVTGSSMSRRLQVREAGSTMVPLGFKRHKPQPMPQVQSLRTTSLPLHGAPPVSQLREVLRVRTDVGQVDLPQGCSSATHFSFAIRSPLPTQSMSAPPTGGLKQLRLSSVINKRSSALSTHSSSIASSILSLDRLFNSSTPQSPSVSSTTSFSHNSLLSLPCKQIPEQTHHTLQRSLSSSPVLQAADDAHFVSRLSSCHHDLQSVSAPVQRSKSWRLSHYRAGSRNYSPVDDARRLSRRTSILSLSYAVDEEQEIDEDIPIISQAFRSSHTDGWTPTIAPAAPVHAIATPKPTLLFAIASDDVDQVRQVLESGDAGPNDSVGPQSALAFTLTNDKLTHKPEIVKALLAYGANPSVLHNPTLNPAYRTHGVDEPNAPPPETTLEGMDPATRYFVSRADAAHTRQTSQLIYRSFFRPLTRVRYDVIGQDWALEQLFRVLSMHSQKLAVAPIVVLLCGPSGHGKSLLARKFGYLLDVPTHTVNMTTLRSTHDIWQSYSMSPYEEPSSCTLADFLVENEGKRCVVVLDEIEKVEDQKALWSLLMPWELGRCSLEAGKRHVDARNVIWLATSNIGHELVFEYHERRSEPDSRMSREDYLELTVLLRPRVSHCLGASLVSRVTAVLPFVPFTLDEKKAIAAEAIYAFVSEAPKMCPREVESLVMKALPSYHPSEGARSLHRAISNILMDTV